MTMSLEDYEEPLASRKVVRRGLLAGLAGLGAAAMLKVTGANEAEATANATLNAASTASYGVLASPGAASAPVEPTLGGTTHGVIGSNTAVTVIPFGSGVAGARNGANLAGVIGSNGSDGFGVYGVSQSGAGVQGQSTSGVGLRGVSTNFVGLVGISTGNIGLYGNNNVPNVPAFYAENLSGAPVAGFFYGDVQVQGNFSVVGGAKAAAVVMPDGTQAMMYSQEAPEPFFEDFGKGRLAGGVAQVTLDPEFASLVQLGDYYVFAFPEGDTRGLFVSRKTPAGFEVRECGGGTGNIAFTYRIVARRKDIPGKRFARLDPGLARSVAAIRASSVGSTAAAGGRAPVPPGVSDDVFVGPRANPVVPVPNVPGPTAPNNLPSQPPPSGNLPNITPPPGPAADRPPLAP
jgi:hypothetical protein